MRWTVHGVPRVPWEAEGIFDGISTFKVDNNGKIFEHAVNNLILRDPPRQGNPILAGLNLIRLPRAQELPCPGAWFKAQLEVRLPTLEGNSGFALLAYEIWPVPLTVCIASHATQVKSRGNSLSPI